MVESGLQRRVLLSLGFLRKTMDIAGKRAAWPADDDTLDGESRAAAVRDWLAEARAEIARLEQQIEAFRGHVTDEAAITRHQRAALADKAAHGKIPAKQANHLAHEYSVRLEHALEEEAQYAWLLRLLRGEEQAPLPDLSPHRYREALSHLDTEGHEQYANTDTAKFGGLSDILRRWRKAFMARTDRSDRVAMTLALFVCCGVFLIGYWYVYHKGTVELAISPLGDMRYSVVCVNATHESMLLELPFSGTPLETGAPERFSIRVTLVEHGSSPLPTPPHETLWLYKDQPAHLHGPLIVGPLTRAEFILDLSAIGNVPAIGELVLSIVRAPEKIQGLWTAPLVP